MPSKRKTLPENTPTTDTAMTNRHRSCRTCRSAVPAGTLLHGECPTCAGLVPLPLRGEGGRFLPGLTTSTGSTGGAQ